MRQIASLRIEEIVVDVWVSQPLSVLSLLQCLLGYDFVPKTDRFILWIQDSAGSQWHTIRMLFPSPYLDVPHESVAAAIIGALNFFII